MIRVVTGNSISRDLTNYDFGIESRVQDFFLDFWIRACSFSSVKELEVTNQLSVISWVLSAWDHPGVHHRRFNCYSVNACVNVAHNKAIESFSCTQNCQYQCQLIRTTHLSLLYTIAYHMQPFLLVYISLFFFSFMIFHNPVVSVLLTQHLTQGLFMP